MSIFAALSKKILVTPRWIAPSAFSVPLSLSLLPLGPRDAGALRREQLRRRDYEVLQTTRR